MRVRTNHFGLDYFNHTPALWLRAAAASLDEHLSAALCLKQWSGARLTPVPVTAKVKVAPGGWVLR
jgi:hypothetical protein